MPKTKTRSKSATFVQKNIGLSLSEKLQSQLQGNQSYLNLVLGILIVFIAGLLAFNYFSKGNNDQSKLGPAQTVNQEAVVDADPNNLPGKYTVKEGDTLFIVAQKYYNDGYKFDRIAQTNKITDVDRIEVGQVLEIPKLEEPKTELAKTEVAKENLGEGTGGAINQTTWGEKIDSDSYTVMEGDWLSTIAGRAYGDIMAYNKIAEANNIADPNLITPGTVLRLPR